MERREVNAISHLKWLSKRAVKARELAWPHSFKFVLLWRLLSERSRIASSTPKQALAIFTAALLVENSSVRSAIG
jgi:hypothetical protein